MDDIVDCWGNLATDDPREGLMEGHKSFYGMWGRMRYRTGPALELDVEAGHICTRNVWGVRCFTGKRTYSIANSANKTQIAVASGHGCMLGQGGSVHCFGVPPHLSIKAQAEREDRMTEDAPLAPVRLPLPPSAEIAVSNNGTCAVSTAGEVRCLWETHEASRDAQAHKPSLPPARALAMGIGTACALGRDGAVRCFRAHEDKVSEVSGLSDAVEITSGPNHYCARRAGGQVACWALREAYNDDRPLKNRELSDIELDVAAARGGKHLTVGMGHMCFTAPDGSARCFGDNTLGQLGRAQHAVSKPAGLQGARRLYRYPDYICAQLPETFRCLHQEGKLLELSRAGLRGDIGFPPQYSGQPTHEVAALTDDGQLVSTAAPDDLDEASPFWQPVRAQRLAGRQSPLPVKARWIGKSSLGLAGFDIVAGEDGSWWFKKDAGPYKVLKRLRPVRQLIPPEGFGNHLCYLLRDRTVRCEAQNTRGLEELDKAKGPAGTPVLLDDVDKLSANCALRQGTLSCWELGVGEGKLAPLPGLPTSLRAFDGDFSEGCALTQGGEVYFWHHRQTDGRPRKIAGLPAGVVEIAYTRYFGCARNAAGEVACWGEAPAIHQRYGPGPVSVGDDQPSPDLDQTPRAEPTARALEIKTM